MTAPYSDTIPVAAIFRPMVELALARLGYLNPLLSITYDGHSILVSSASAFDERQVRKDVLYALYRQKIYAETLSMRKALVNAVSAP